MIAIPTGIPAPAPRPMARLLLFPPLEEEEEEDTVAAAAAVDIVGLVDGVRWEGLRVDEVGEESEMSRED